MKKIRNLIVVFLLLAILVAGYFAISFFLKSEDGGENTPSIKASEIDTALIKGFSYSYAGKAMSFYIENAEWKDESNPSTPLKQSPISTMCGNLGNVIATRKVPSDKDSLSEYGLDDPTMTINITLTDGGKRVYKIGGLNEVVNGYYFMTSESEDVYLITDSLLLSFTKTLDDLIMLEQLPVITADVVSSVSMKEDGVSQLFSLDGSDLRYYYYQYSYFRFMNGETKPIDSVQGKQLFEKASALSFISYADYTDDEKKIAAYGLDAENAFIMRVEYIEYLDSNDDVTTTTPFKVTKEFILYIGNEADGETYYARMDESNMICKISKADIDMLKSYMSSDLTSRDVFGVNADTIESMDINFDKKSYKVVYSESDNSYTIGNKKVSAEVFAKLLDMLSALHADKFVSSEQSGQNVFSMDIKRYTNEVTFDTYKQIKLDIYEFDQDYYIADFDIVKGLMIPKESAEGVLEFFRSLIA